MFFVVSGSILTSLDVFPTIVLVMMGWKTFLSSVLAMVGFVGAIQATTRYVNVGNPTPVWPYTSWETAATNIQDAVDAAEPGDEILVTNGVYATGGRDGNRVTITKSVIVRSVNGPEVTLIVGSGPKGSNAVRCVYMTGGAMLIGFTLTNGVQGHGGGAFGGTLYDCILTGNSADWGGGAYGCRLYNCILASNSVTSGGGGAYSCILSNCVVTGNSAQYGGGTYECELYNSVLTSNSAGWYGGGAFWGTLSNCVVTGNSAKEGGGTWAATLYTCSLRGNSAQTGGGAVSGRLYGCTIESNSAIDRGGGVHSSMLSNCTLIGNLAWLGGGASDGTLSGCRITGNSALKDGGGVYAATLYNCTLTGNSAQYGGGTHSSTLYNCIVYYNNAQEGANYYNSTLNYCCTTPLPTNGVGNIDADPQLASAWRISCTSPCRGAGNADYAGGLDIDGEPWANPPSIGCDEYWVGAVTGALSAAIDTEYIYVKVGIPLDFRAIVDGRVAASCWDFGDGVIVSNRPYVRYAWSAPGRYPLRLYAFNETHPEGVVATKTIEVVEQAIHYVDVRSPGPVWPYISWATAATNIQDAVDAAAPGAVILVNDGVYSTGGRVVYGMSNRVAVTKPMVVRSVNGPGVTWIVGAGPRGSNAVRCVYLTNGAMLVGFTLTNGATHEATLNLTNLSGGGVWCESESSVVSNCVIVGNSAYCGGGVYRGTIYNSVVAKNSAGYGGGANASVLYNCALTGNSAEGAYGSTLYNCTVVGNSTSGYGVRYSTLYNCIVYYNGVFGRLNYDLYSTLYYCCTTPRPPRGSGNITNAPLFVDTNNWSDLRLQTNSPCINAGNNSYAFGEIDLDGNPRIAGACVDIGAYEFQGTNLSGFADWLWRHGCRIDGSDDFSDPDGDGHNNWQEWVAGTNPTNVASVLRMLWISGEGGNVVLSWSSVEGRRYTVEYSTNLDGGVEFWPLQTNIVGLPGATIWRDTNVVQQLPRFYRVRVEGQ